MHVCGFGNRNVREGSVGNREHGSEAPSPALGWVRLGLLDTTWDWLALGVRQ